MITEQELTRARNLVQEIVASVNNDRDRAIEIIVEASKQDPELQQLFAKVGLELYTSSVATRH